METENLNTTSPKKENLPEPTEETQDLSAQPWQERLKTLYQYKRQARIAHAENRREMATDEDFYDKIQYDAEDLMILAERRQPALVYNITKNTVNWILGTEKKARIDYRVLPRVEAEAKNAKVKTKLFKYIEDVNYGPFVQSKAFADCIKAGLGWIEEGARAGGEEPIFKRNESWRNMWFDHLGVSIDGSDWRYVFREKWIDLDILIKMWPDKEEELTAAAENVNSLFPYVPDGTSVSDDASEFDLESNILSAGGLSIDYTRFRLRLTEMYYRIPAQVKLLKQLDKETPYGALHGALYRPEDPEHQYLIKGKYFTTLQTYRMIVRQGIFAGTIYLQDILSPYNHWRFPFIPMFCYRRSRDNMPYGVIRDVRDPQTDLNKRRLRSLFLITAHQIEYEKGALDDPIITQEEVNRPDGSIELNEGALTGKKFRRVDHIQEAAAHVNLAEQDAQFVQDISGVTDENMGKKTNATSGIAIQARQLQGNTTSAVFFDNYYLAFQLAGEIENALIEQFMDQEKEVLITGDQVKDEFITINKKNENGDIENCITKSKARFIVGKQDFRESVRLAMLETLGELVTNLSKTMPQVSLALLDMVVDYMDDIPNKDELVARIRKINNQFGPDEDMTDEEKLEAQQTQKAIQEKQAMMEQINMALAKSKADNEAAQAAMKTTQAMKNSVEATMKKLEGFLKALEAAAIVKNDPELTKAADMLVSEAEKMPGQGESQGRRQIPRGQMQQRQLTQQGAM